MVASARPAKGLHTQTQQQSGCCLPLVPLGWLNYPAVVTMPLQLCGGPRGAVGVPMGLAASKFTR